MQGCIISRSTGRVRLLKSRWRFVWGLGYSTPHSARVPCCVRRCRCRYRAVVQPAESVPSARHQYTRAHHLSLRTTLVVPTLTSERIALSPHSHVVNTPSTPHAHFTRRVDSIQPSHGPGFKTSNLSLFLATTRSIQRIDPAQLERLLASHAFALPVSRPEAAAAGYSGNYGGGTTAKAPSRALQYTRSGAVLGAAGGSRSHASEVSGQVRRFDDGQKGGRVSCCVWTSHVKVLFFEGGSVWTTGGRACVVWVVGQMMSKSFVFFAY